MPASTIALVEQLFDALNSQDLPSIRTCLSSDYDEANVTLETSHVGLPEVEHALQSLFSAFPDIRFQTHGAVPGNSVNGEIKITVFWSMKATHLGSFHRIPATGLPVGTAGSSIFMVHDGQMQRGLHVWDLGGLLRSMRLLPNPEGTHPDATAKSISAFFAA